MTAVLLVLAAFVAYGRFMIVPLLAERSEQPWFHYVRRLTQQQRIMVVVA